jgi:hypothetical protein
MTSQYTGRPPGYPPDLSDGLCIGGRAGLDAEAWTGEDAALRVLAIRTCGYCPVAGACRAWAAALPGSLRAGVVLAGVAYRNDGQPVMGRPHPRRDRVQQEQAQRELSVREQRVQAVEESRELARQAQRERRELAQQEHPPWPHAHPGADTQTMSAEQGKTRDTAVTPAASAVTTVTGVTPSASTTTAASATATVTPVATVEADPVV